MQRLFVFFSFYDTEGKDAIFFGFRFLNIFLWLAFVEDKHDEINKNQLHWARERLFGYKVV